LRKYLGVLFAGKKKGNGKKMLRSFSTVLKVFEVCPDEVKI